MLEVTAGTEAPTGGGTGKGRGHFRAGCWGSLRGLRQWRSLVQWPEEQFGDQGVLGSLHCSTIPMHLTLTGHLPSSSLSCLFCRLDITIPPSQVHCEDKIIYVTHLAESKHSKKDDSSRVVISISKMLKDTKHILVYFAQFFC